MVGASAVRVGQPGPVALHRAKVSGGTRRETDVRTLPDFGRPRGLRIFAAVAAPKASGRTSYARRARENVSLVQAGFSRSARSGLRLRFMTSLTCLLRAAADVTYLIGLTFGSTRQLRTPPLPTEMLAIPGESPTPFSLRRGLQQGPLAPGITPPRSYFGPVRLPLAVGRFPAVPSHTACLAPVISARDKQGLSSCSARPCHHVVDNHPAGAGQRISRVAMNHVAFAITVDRSASGAGKFRGHLSFACATAW